MRKFVLLLLIMSMILSGCRSSQANQTENGVSEPDTTSVTVHPLPDSTMDSLDNATVAVSLEEGDAYVDDTGIMRMDVTVYSYDLFDMVDIAGLKTGDILITHSGEVKVSTIERNEFGTVLINGGLENEGFDLFGKDGVYYESGFNDVKNWYKVGEVTLRVSTDLVFKDNIDIEKGEQIYYAGSFLVGEVTDYNFTPYNTTIRIENGQIESIERVYTP